MHFTVTLTRKVGQRTSDDIIKKQVDKLLGLALKGQRGKSWHHTVSRGLPPEQDAQGMWVFTRKVTFNKTKGHLAKAPAHWKQICEVLVRSGQSSSFKQYPWWITGSGAEELYTKLAIEGKISPITGGGVSAIVGDKSEGEPSAKRKSGMLKDYANINTDLGPHFNHIFGRDDQISIIHSAIEAAKESAFHNRFHCVLQGPPGCGKSEILSAIGKMLGKENEAYLKLDATSTTEAGAIRILLEEPHIPPVLIMEEIEKTDEKSLRWLLGILDHRAEIRKTNFNIGHRARNVKMLCLATVNDIKLFRKVMSGALFSRFAHEIFCPRPDKATMQKILEREVAKVNGRLEWIEPTVKFCMDVLKINDPRKIVPICLCGRDKLLDGTYQLKVLNTMSKKKLKRLQVDPDAKFSETKDD
jgi:energy-coupling factor transporter ATP-binding protein EcfA2